MFGRRNFYLIYREVFKMKIQEFLKINIDVKISNKWKRKFSMTEVQLNQLITKYTS